MIPLAEARALVLDRCPPLVPRRVPLAEAAGCVAAEAAVADEPIPPFANSAMDGVAVRSADVAGASSTRPVALRVVATLAAGDAPDPDRPLGPGEAVRIMTGAPVPPGADAVVMVEQTRPLGEDEVEVLAAATPGQSIRDAGEDVQPGDEVIPAGTVLTPAHLGVLASLGRAEVTVVPRPVVGVLSTGDELVGPGRPLAPGQIRDSNRVGLVAMVVAMGATPLDLGVVGDEEAAFEEALREGASRCDLLVTSGGVSMGEFDVVKAVLGRVADMRWVQIAIKPAKPFAIGVLPVAGRQVPIVGLPGNPVSSLVSFALLAHPAIRAVAGRADLDLPTVAAVAPEGISRRPDGKVHHVRVQVGRAADPVSGAEHLVVRPVGERGSHQLAKAAGATGLAEVPDGEGVAPGGVVRVRLLDPAAALSPLGST